MDENLVKFMFVMCGMLMLLYVKWVCKMFLNIFVELGVDVIEGDGVVIVE